MNKKNKNENDKKNEDGSNGGVKNSSRKLFGRRVMLIALACTHPAIADDLPNTYRIAAVDAFFAFCSAAEPQHRAEYRTLELQVLSDMKISSDVVEKTRKEPFYKSSLPVLTAEFGKTYSSSAVTACAIPANASHMADNGDRKLDSHR